jgi:hypothetical protein
MAGYKLWASDEVLTAADLNGYLMTQAVPRFADSSTRSGAILSPAAGQLTYRIDGGLYEEWNGSAWVALGNAIGTATVAATAGTATYAVTAGTATNASKVSNQTIFIQSSTPTALATDDLWFW